MNRDALREALANLAHQQWSGWMWYLFQNAAFNDDGTVTIPEAFADRWKRQARMSYRELSEQEKDSDRKEADTVLELLDVMGVLK
jgi:hypothetical protein